MCVNVEFRKSQVEVLEASLSKLIPKIAKPQSKADTILSQWKADFETLRTKGYFQPGLEWKPIPDVRHGNKKTPANELFTTQEQFHEVPNVIHPGWAAMALGHQNCRSCSPKQNEAKRLRQKCS